MAHTQPAFETSQHHRYLQHRQGVTVLRRDQERSDLREIAAHENLSKRRVMQVIDLAFLAPDILKLIVQGNQPLGLTAKWLGINPLPSDWQAQRRIDAALWQSLKPRTTQQP